MFALMLAPLRGNLLGRDDKVLNVDIGASGHIARRAEGDCVDGAMRDLLASEWLVVEGVAGAAKCEAHSQVIAGRRRLFIHETCCLAILRRLEGQIARIIAEANTICVTRE